jgi:subtilisin family serine protease
MRNSVMARFVVANRRAGKFTEQAKVAARAAADNAVEALARHGTVLEDRNPPDATARRMAIIEADPAEARRLRQELPREVILEPEIIHHTTSVPPADFLNRDPARLAGPVLSGRRTTLRVVVTGGGKPMEGAQVVAFLRGLQGVERRIEAVTDDKGRVSLVYGSFFRVSALRINPPGGFWGVLLRGPGNTVEIDCPALPQDGPLAWWHSLAGVDRFRETRGKGIRVGVIDTGVGPHAALGHVERIGAFIGGEVMGPEGAGDVDSHGSHVCGIIGARPASTGGYAGIAPGADLLSARVFPPGEGANQADIVNAIEALSRDHRVDLINMSLGAPVASEIEQDGIIDALERGTLCICAAANSNGPVEYPAAFPECVAVSALGLLGWGPPESVAASRVPTQADRFAQDNLYLANFSCFGPEIDGAAPGVGIISTVPERYGLTAPYAAFDGTSMASPVACGTLAAVLAESDAYLKTSRDQTRAALARQLLHDHCRDIGLAVIYQGRGVCRLP